jgi:large subunit ribosomal protein LP2
MHEVAALLLCKLGGKSGSADEVKEVLTAAGLEANEDALTKLLGDLEGKDMNEILAAGAEKIKDVPFSGGGSGGGGGGGDGGDAGPAEIVSESAPEEEEVDMGGGMDMFGADEGDAGGGGDY